MPLKTIVKIKAFCLSLFLAAGTANAQSGAPLWVNEMYKAFNESDWVCAVVQGASKQEAESAAAASLARAFNVDVKSVSNVMQSFSQSQTSFSQDKSLKQQVDTSSDVAGLMGVITDFWTAPDGTCYAIARMNRKEGATTYSPIIKQYSSTIETLLEDAAAAPGTFAAYEALAFASNLATLNDNYLNILSVLNNSARQSIKISYGGAAAVRNLMQKAASEIVIYVEVSGDEAGNIAKAFASVFSKRKFKTSSVPYRATYTLSAEFSLENKEEAPGNTHRVRYLINAVLQDSDGEELLSFTENKRVTSTTQSNADIRAVRDAEKSITGTGFAKNFDEYLASLLGK
ncbi:MAG: hypothetical protein LBC27_01105 [Spirochaetaceae bacterium]|jgi:hypothetical protein|nr:hypothetical protein [Spirochaetaceae bacterium]